MSSSKQQAPLPFIGNLLQGERNAITDVAGVTVGHRTLADGPVQTGVTVIRPHAGDPFRDKVPAAAVVLNGFGKSVGLLQVEELGVLETPIALTNTFSVGTVAAAQIRRCVADNPETGRTLPTVNPLVFECNDGFLNDIQRMAVSEADYLQALADAGADFEQGSVGAGRGMSSFQLKGGIGSASRRVSARNDGTSGGLGGSKNVGTGGLHTVGALVLANYGRQPQLLLAGHAVGERLAALQAERSLPAVNEAEKGSIIIVLATDAPLDARQLRRLALRAGAGLARTGSVFGHGSGDIVLAFSTAYTVPGSVDRPMPAVAMLHDGLLDGLFQAAADSTEQAIIHALWRATPVTGRDGNHRAALGDVLPASTLFSTHA
ncbi:P1 family peptidase [Variovorax sp. NFACC27]|uniref:S58 family peptidase n=1 Tax=Variovorax gossypii TaxID=1679495 RepID=A0A431TS82_9BURK|nr:P1 family peptidase [Variovorax gossypii]MDP9600684.1 D-aminopeptidase [Variovorax paradoxus]SEF27737.1 L-aminopeptidase DmpA. Serine peptidase. MEROPS family S58 [Variovorax sp. NFACC28]SEG72580.1 L-aminopeptidase DmpA. Serine peptidase. MEROPS family S58 [Variovorax sp. NFACC29]SFC77657.1 L-aminopeptidase DmpA. Serine peptidase. MEROPS family S58 [Variovorax sp. NFACC26]SFG00837.1 L-aminopeptidase DmpA. Serine peptidase. MEROPS family S58 [Variovorax sp. NFACC27]